MLNDSKSMILKCTILMPTAREVCVGDGVCGICFKERYRGDELHFLAYDGVHSGRFEDGLVSLKMNPVTGVHDNGDDRCWMRITSLCKVRAFA